MATRSVPGATGPTVKSVTEASAGAGGRPQELQTVAGVTFCNVLADELFEVRAGVQAWEALGSAKELLDETMALLGASDAENHLMAAYYLASAAQALVKAVARGVTGVSEAGGSGDATSRPPWLTAGR